MLFWAFYDTLTLERCRPATPSGPTLTRQDAVLDLGPGAGTSLRLCIFLLNIGPVGQKKHFFCIFFNIFGRASGQIYGKTAEKILKNRWIFGPFSFLE